MAQQKHGLRLAVFVIATFIGIYAARPGNLDWLPNSVIFLVMGAAGLYWLWNEPNVRETLSAYLIVAESKLIDPSTLRPLSVPRHKRRRAAWTVLIVMVVCLSVGGGLLVLRLFSGSPLPELNRARLIPHAPGWAPVKIKVSKQMPTTMNPFNTDWMKPISKIRPPREDEAKMMRPLLEEEDRIREMEPKARINYYHTKARELELFGTEWLPIENNFDSWSPVSPVNDTPQELKRYQALMKLDQMRVHNYQQYRIELPKAREKGFKESFPLINAPIGVMYEMCQKKGITVQEPGVNSESAIDISQFFRTYSEKCLGTD